jgi:hypothetical protein
MRGDATRLVGSSPRAQVVNDGLSHHG